MKYTIKTFNETEKVKEAVKEYKILGGDDFTFKPVPVLESEMRILLMDATISPNVKQRKMVRLTMSNYSTSVLIKQESMSFQN